MLYIHISSRPQGYYFISIAPICFILFFNSIINILVLFKGTNGCISHGSLQLANSNVSSSIEAQNQSTCSLLQPRSSYPNVVNVNRTHNVVEHPLLSDKSPTIVHLASPQPPSVFFSEAESGRPVQRPSITGECSSSALPVRLRSELPSAAGAPSLQYILQANLVGPPDRQRPVSELIGMWSAERQLSAPPPNPAAESDARIVRPIPPACLLMSRRARPRVPHMRPQRDPLAARPVARPLSELYDAPPAGEHWVHSAHLPVAFAKAGRSHFKFSPLLPPPVCSFSPSQMPGPSQPPYEPHQSARKPSLLASQEPVAQINPLAQQFAPFQSVNDMSALPDPRTAAAARTRRSGSRAFGSQRSLSHGIRSKFLRTRLSSRSRMKSAETLLPRHPLNLLDEEAAAQIARAKSHAIVDPEAPPSSARPRASTPPPPESHSQPDLAAALANGDDLSPRLTLRPSKPNLFAPPEPPIAIQWLRARRTIIEPL